MPLFVQGEYLDGSGPNAAEPSHVSHVLGKCDGTQSQEPSVHISGSAGI